MTEQLQGYGQSMDLNEVMITGVDPLAIFWQYEASNPGVFPKHTERIITELYRRNSDGSINAENHVLEHWTGTSTSSKSSAILARVKYMQTHPLYRRMVEENGFEPVYTYHNFMTDLIIGRKLGLVTSPLGQIPPDQYESVREYVTEPRRKLAFDYLPGPEHQNQPVFRIEDTVSITGLYWKGRILGDERGGSKGLRRLIARRFPVFNVAVNISEELKNKVMKLRQEIPLLPDEAVIPYLINHQVYDTRIDNPQAVKESYINSGNLPIRDQQYQTIAGNMGFLMRNNLMSADYSYNTPPLWREFWTTNPKRWEQLLNEYIQIWQKLIYAQEEPIRAVFFNPSALQPEVLRFEDRDWFEKYSDLRLLKRVAEQTGNQYLTDKLGELTVIP